MATTKEFKNYVLERLDLLDNLRCKPMMGGYLFYYHDTLFGGLYGGDYFLVKMTNSNKKYQLNEKVPYDGSKKIMYLIEDFSDKEKLKNIVLDTCKDL